MPRKAKKVSITSFQYRHTQNGDVGKVLRPVISGEAIAQAEHHFGHEFTKRIEYTCDWNNELQCWCITPIDFLPF